MRYGIGLVGLLAWGCKPAEEVEPFADVAVDREVTLAGLGAPAEVLFTEAGVPHVYAVDLIDAARVQGFLYARDRLFTLDLARRLALGQVSGLLGSLGTSTDVDSRLIGMTHVAEQLLVIATPDQRARLLAYAEGVNEAIVAMQAGELPLPSELGLAGPLLGADDPATLLAPFTERDVAGVLATLVYQLAFSREDLDNEATIQQLSQLSDEVAFGELRREGALYDLFGAVAPVYPRVGAPQWLSTSPAAPTAGPVIRAEAPPPMLDELRRRLDRLGELAGAGTTDDRGSNAWAVHKRRAGGRALLAGDGHLPLTVPSLFWQVGVDTAVLGDGDVELLGLGLLGLPGLAVGTNGHVAWSQTRLRGDAVDWYDEVLQLDPATGAPLQSRFRGEWRDLVALPEQIEVAAALGAEAETLSWTRYQTFDGRFLVSIEGEPVDGERLPSDVRVADDWLRPSDVDGDGAIRAISLDYTAFDPSALLSAMDGFAGARSVAEFREATRYLNGYGQNIVAADRHGDVLYTSYQAAPCRDALRQPGLSRNDPTRLLDGSEHPGFTIPLTDDGQVDEAGSDCVVPFDDHPWEISPPSGWVMSANQDPGGWSLDGDLFDDAAYMGGPWDVGHRAERIATLLDADDSADLDSTLALQSDATAADAVLILPYLLAALDAAAAGSPGPSDAGQAAAAWQDDTARLSDARARLRAWADRGHRAASGVQTFYDEPDDDARADAVATMIYYAWQATFTGAVFDDEGLPDGVWRPSASSGVPRALHKLLGGRGAGNPGALASWVPATGESALFDTLGTEAVEGSELLMVRSLSDALSMLGGSSGAGFGTDDPEAWLWGLRHVVRFESILAGFLGDQPLIAPLVRAFAITPEVLPLAELLPAGDPRRELDGFPRPGASGSVDAASQGYDPDDYSYASGPAFRMAFSLGPDGVEGYNVLPGGQSALTDSPHFADQAALWLGNEVVPLRFTLEAVKAGTEQRWTFTP